jgi:hypothetical protein
MELGYSIVRQPCLLTVPTESTWPGDPGPQVLLARAKCWIARAFGAYEEPRESYSIQIGGNVWACIDTYILDHITIYI